ncbi:glycogen-binding subunit 76A-like [Octopus vulgaris]|uniref:Glycogen-binding subunit 76A-like n=2 Tax=Octopus TaxID=6643 RepID=A0AA36F0G9_OCTVU|nr:uncharacterized protein LOC115209134 [Octopus sinensis]CAI9719015.1 glycogen-binding subunit 76A-like [Octopus vulgaris]
MCAFSSPYSRFLPRNLSYSEEIYLNGIPIKRQPEVPKALDKFPSKRRNLLLNSIIMADTADDKDPDEYRVKDYIPSFDEGIYINLMDDLSLESDKHEGQTDDSGDSNGILKRFTNYATHLQPLSAGAEGNATGSMANGDNDKSTVNSPLHSLPAAGNSLEETVSGEAPMAGVCAERVCAENTNCSSSRNIVSSVQEYFSNSPRNDTKLLDLLSPQSPIYDDDEFNFSRTQLRKSTSLKTTKTPPGTPRRKKVVRFADVMGLDLESVIHVLNMDSPPKIPASALADLQSGIESDRKSMGARYLTACFAQPSANEGFMGRVCAEKVCLENAVISDLTITGIIRVANIGFHKIVQVRYTTDDWKIHHDIIASYVHSSCDGPTDRFSFSIVTPADFSVGSRLELAISYTCGDIVYWDSNHGENYVFQCFAKAGVTETENAWTHFL